MTTDERLQALEARVAELERAMDGIGQSLAHATLMLKNLVQLLARDDASIIESRG